MQEKYIDPKRGFSFSSFSKDNGCGFIKIFLTLFFPFCFASFHLKKIIG